MGFTDLVESLKGSTSARDKSEVLWQYLHDGRHVDFHRYLLQEAFDPKKLHNVTLKKSDIPPRGDQSLEEVEEQIKLIFNFLSTNYSSKENKHAVTNLMRYLHKEDQLALLGVVNKKLRCGIGIASINKVVTDLIPVVKIQLANKYSASKHKKPHNWFASYKLDGQRVFGIRVKGEWKLYSRDKEYIGREITTLEHWKPDLERVHEVCGADYTDGEAYCHGLKFEEIQSLVSSRVNVKDTERLNYHLFMVGKGEVKEQNILFIPPDKIEDLVIGMKCEYLQAVRQERLLNTPDRIYEYLESAVALGYEGIMLRSIECGQWYDYKRSDCLLKVKTSDTSGTEEIVDCYVEDMDYGDFVIREDGRESIEWLPIRLVVELNGMTMNVGSGFSLEQRRSWKEDESLIVGKSIEVLCQGFGAQGRMRFPRLHRIREDI